MSKKLDDIGYLEPDYTHPISDIEEENFSNSDYKVTTVVPTKGCCKMNIYVMNQDELEAFYEGCINEWAEYIVRIERI